MGDKRYNKSKKVSFISILVNSLLSIAKVFVGFSYHSKVLIADGLHSVSDIASTIVVLISIKLSQTPADEKHPYGHGKAESIGTAILGFMLISTGVFLVRDAATTIISGNLRIPGKIALWVAVISIISKEVLYQYTVKIGRKIKSKGLIADAHHHRSDAFSSLAALIGIAGARLGLPILDPIFALVVAVFIAKIGIDILKDAIHELMDGVMDEEKISEFREKAFQVKGVKKVEDIKLRPYGPKYYIDLSVSVDDELSVAKGHEVAVKVREKLREYNSEVKEVMVHIDPWQKEN
jgi:cation diffusion facilitator family transporter